MLSSFFHFLLPSFLPYRDDDMGFGDENAGSPQPAGQQQFAIWGQPSSGGTAGIVIPPFVPRDQRSKEVWNKGEIAKRDSDKMILAGSNGDFLIRKTKKGHVICVNDNGKLYQAQIRTVADEGLGTFMFSSRMFKTLGVSRCAPSRPRPRHIHVKFKQNGRELLTTQFYFAGEADAQGINTALLIDLKPTIDNANNPILVGQRDVILNISN